MVSEYEVSYFSQVFAHRALLTVDDIYFSDEFQAWTFEDEDDGGKFEDDDRFGPTRVIHRPRAVSSLAGTASRKPAGGVPRPAAVLVYRGVAGAGGPDEARRRQSLPSL
jgi:hypothetical protein